MTGKNGMVVEQLKPVARKASKSASHMMHSISFDPHPARTKAIFGIKVSAITLISALIGRRLLGKAAKSR